MPGLLRLTSTALADSPGRTVLLPPVAGTVVEIAQTFLTGLTLRHKDRGFIDISEEDEEAVEEAVEKEVEEAVEEEVMSAAVAAAASASKTPPTPPVPGAHRTP